MNVEYVSKQSVIELFEILADKMDFSALKVVRQLQGAVIDMVPADVKPITHGKIKPYNNIIICSNCSHPLFGMNTNYCGHCGCKLDGNCI